MVVSRFHELIENLNVKLVVMIENDFTAITDEEEVLTSILNVNSNDLDLLLSELNVGIIKSSMIKKFVSNLNSISNPQKNKAIKGKRVIELFLSIYKDEDQTLKELYEEAQEVKELIKDIIYSNSSSAEILLKYGIVNDLPSYKLFFDELMSITPRKSIRIYKEVPPVEWNNITSDIENIGIEKNEFSLFIVDKLLGEGEATGETFILDYLLKETGKNIISIIYTSKHQDSNVNKLSDYYIVQVSKTDPKFLEQVVEGLATCAYVHLFRRLKEIYLYSIEATFDMALDRRENMNYLAKMAHEEGTTTYDLITSWVDQLKNEVISNQLFHVTSVPSEYTFISGLTNFLNEKFIVREQKALDYLFEKRIQNLNTYELFDYTVNKRNLPPAPGDIFEIDGEYYVLVGQDCDTIVRNDKVERNTKNADLLKCIFLQDPINEKIKTEPRSVTFNFFKADDDEIGALSIKLNDGTVCDFSVLDTCTFNTDGFCALSITDPLDKLLKNVVPKAWDKYYVILQQQFNLIKEFKCILEKQGKDILNIATNDISAYNYQEKDGYITFPIRRVCRLNGEFKDFLIRNYWNYRSRIGVNTIAFTDTETVQLKKVEYGYPGQKYIIVEQEYQGIVKREKQKSILDSEMIVNADILKQLCPNLMTDRNMIVITDTVCNDIKTKTLFEKIIEDNVCVGIKITLPYIIKPHNKLINKKSITLFDLFDSELLTDFHNQKPEIFKFLDTEEDIPTYIERKPFVFAIENLSNGLYIPKII
ncbi:hypothetical protein D3C74_105780 [compost metagenome]